MGCASRNWWDLDFRGSFRSRSMSLIASDIWLVIGRAELRPYWDSEFVAHVLSSTQLSSPSASQHHKSQRCLLPGPNAEKL
jgi:hypothetical protein